MAERGGFESFPSQSLPLTVDSYIATDANLPPSRATIGTYCTLPATPGLKLNRLLGLRYLGCASDCSGQSPALCDRPIMDAA